MDLRRALFIAACVAGATSQPALAQFAPQQAPAAVAPWPDQQPQQTPWPQQQQQQQQQLQETCVEDFGKLRDAAQKKATAIRMAGEHKATAKEACGLFNSFSEAEMKIIKFASDNLTKCGIPPEVLTTLKKGHVNTTELRTKVCRAAEAPAHAAAPSLSDALGSATVPDASNIKTGRGTFDTLTGTPLGGK
jgi:hypothetical protein